MRSKRAQWWTGIDLWSLPAVTVVAFLATTAGGAIAATYTPLLPVENVRVRGHSPAYPGGRYEAENLLDGNPATEYSSNGAGTKTFVEFDFGRPVTIRGLRHVDRNDPATVARSEIVLSDRADCTDVSGEVLPRSFGGFGRGDDLPAGQARHGPLRPLDRDRARPERLRHGGRSRDRLLRGGRSGRESLARHDGSRGPNRRSSGATAGPCSRWK